ncbi:MAG: bifunctional phosphopantothenoylcysteine decarboxylase/phosphopantothenate--cysteine ligase CoaBC [Brachybacterium sp.]|nr:bifunctional phosphopantothenoylcysteine decarboxylase/phosphopantothenate--cysteine ligase CoaBC [Brachybacterium sp.]
MAEAPCPSAEQSARDEPAQKQFAALDGARVLVGVSGGIAAYKAAHLVRGLVAAGADVRVIPTESSLEFVGAATWEALSHHRVLTSVFEDVDEVAHVRLGQEADLLVIAPATADLLARLRAGRADDMLSAAALVTRAPVVLAPAMHTEMWEHPATQENVEVLRERGVHIIDPAVGRLTGPDSGPGRLPEPAAILARVQAVAAAPRGARGAVVQDLAGRRVVISAGGTREAIDPVRYLTNHSSGKQGWALAHAALARGAEVTVLAANVDLDTPPGATRIDVTGAADLHRAVQEQAEAADVLVMAAAVADYAPAAAGSKWKKTSEGDVPQLVLSATPDILRGAVRARADAGPDRAAEHPRVIVGFAAETGDADSSALDLARAKARRKGADLVVFNDVSGSVFGGEDTAVAVLDVNGTTLAEASGSKVTAAHAVIDQVVQRLADVTWTA